jgi:imidazolonepropionase-like amidohydrolase
MARVKRRRPWYQLGTVAFIGAALPGPNNPAEAEDYPARTAFSNVNAVDLASGQILRNRRIVIAGDRVVAVQDASTPPQVGVDLVPADGKFMIPGLWDMHAHVVHESYLGLFVANGVTGVRDMGGGLDAPGDGCESVEPSVLRRWRSEAIAGKRLGPELLISGPAVSGTGWPTSIPARTPAEARAAVGALRRQGADFIKVYDRIPLAAYQVLVSEAKRSGLWFAGHVLDNVGPLAAIQAGQRSIEHVRDAMLVCFTGSPDELERFFAEDRWGEADKQWGRTAHAACPNIIAALQAGDVWLTPTLVVEKSKVSVEDARHVSDERRRHLPQSVRRGYAAYVKAKLAQSPAERASERLWWRTQQRLAQRMNKFGVKLLAGTDSACEGGLPGFSLHDELEELVTAGLSPLEALRTATVEPARYFGRTDEGRVLPGHRANLLLLDANPLDDIKNTQRISLVVLRGKVLRPQHLDRLRR